MTLYAKLWVDILSDPKLMRARREGAEHLVVLPWIIAFAKRADDDGALTIGGRPAEPEDIARDIPMPRALKSVAGCLKELERIGVLVRETDVLRFASWEVRASEPVPGEPKSSSGERMRRHRLRKRQERQAARDRSAEFTSKSDGSDVTRDADGDAVSESIEQTEESNGRHSNASRHDLARKKEEPEVDVVMAHYRSVHPKRRPGERERAAVRKALKKLGYAPQDLIEAIDGNAGDDWHREKAKHDLPYVLRDSGKIDDFRARFDAQKPVPAVDPETGLPNAAGLTVISGGRR